MAEPLEQSEIDDLLNSAGDFDDPDIDDLGTDDLDESTPHRKIANFRTPEEKPFRFKFRYKSPIVKSNSYLLNPDEENDPESSQPVVRTLSNYAYNKRAQDD